MGPGPASLSLQSGTRHQKLGTALGGRSPTSDSACCCTESVEKTGDQRSPGNQIKESSLNMRQIKASQMPVGPTPVAGSRSALFFTPLALIFGRSKARVPPESYHLLLYLAPAFTLTVDSSGLTHLGGGLQTHGPPLGLWTSTWARRPSLGLWLPQPC